MSFKFGDRVVCKGTMDGRNIDGQLASIHHVYEQNPPRFCVLKFDRDFDKGGIYWDVFYEQLQLVNSKFNLNDIVKVLSGDHKYEVGTILNYPDEQGRWPVQIGLNKVIHLKPRYLVLEGRKQLI